MPVAISPIIKGIATPVWRRSAVQSATAAKRRRLARSKEWLRNDGMNFYIAKKNPGCGCSRETIYYLARKPTFL